MNTRRILAPAVLLATMLGGCATAPADAPSAGHRQQVDVSYRCEGGVELEVSYLNPPTGESFASIHFEGRTVVMQSRPSASGVRYVDLDEQRGLRWRTKGDEGFLAMQPADHTAKETILINQCRAFRER